MANKTTADLASGDRVTIDRLAYPFDATVDRVEPTGSYVMGSTTLRVLAVYFTDAPRVIKRIESAETAPWVLAS